MSKNKILVTGSEGFFGSHLTEALVKAGHNVKAFVLYNSFNSWGWLDQLPPDVLKEIEIFTGDVRDAHCVKKAMTDCDVVYHLAALIGIPYSYNAPASYIDTNVNGTLNIVQAAKDLGTSQVIHTSTSEVYGTAQYVPINESHPLQGQSPYSASKIGADAIALSYFNSFDTPVTILRPFNIYGPRQSARAVLPTIILQIANGLEKIVLGDDSTSRDFNFVADTVAAYMAALKLNNIAGETINVSSNYEVTIKDSVGYISQLMNKNITIVTDKSKMRPQKSEVRQLLGDNTLAKKLLNWEPNYSGVDGFKRGLEKTISWYKNPTNIKNFKAEIYNI
ncbi:NAD-dependent dehydratase [bacterium K02(2017)]|nr:NAD-dependent dehydratase [bacterium K02(2017)]